MPRGKITKTFFLGITCTDELCATRPRMYVEKVDNVNLNFMLTLTDPIKANKQLHAESHQHKNQIKTGFHSLSEMTQP